MLLNLGRAILKLALGAALGVGLLEAVLQANPRLLIRGMAAPIPIDEPLNIREYAVRRTDADLFFWHAALIRPIAPADDAVEAQVRFATDEFGFPNAAPAGGEADVIVLGRSFALGAQAERPWPQRLADETGLQVLNLSQAAVGIDGKRDYWRRFGRLHNAKWVVVEVLPSMDILGFGPTPRSLTEQLPFPLLQALARSLSRAGSGASELEPIYPLTIDVGPRQAEVVFFSYYLAALSASQADIAASIQWAAYQEAVLVLVDEAREDGACVMLAYAPTKEEVYVPLVVSPEQLTPALEAGWDALVLIAGGQLAQTASPPQDARTLQAESGAARTLVHAFAAEHGLPLADPTEAMQAAARTGDDPFMRYDSHWSATGHALVAHSVADAISGAACP